MIFNTCCYVPKSEAFFFHLKLLNVSNVFLIGHSIAVSKKVLVKYFFRLKTIKCLIKLNMKFGLLFLYKV